MSFNCSDRGSHLDLESWCHGFLSPSTKSSFPHSFYHHETPAPPVPQPCVSSRAMAREPLGPLQEPVPETAAGRWRGHPHPMLTHSLTIASQLMVGLL